MKTLVWIHNVARRTVGDDLFNELVTLCPDDVKSDRIYFECTLEDTDPKLDEVEKLLRSAGLHRRQEGESFSDNMYGAVERYEYEPSDLERASYFKPYLWGVELDALGRLPDRKLSPIILRGFGLTRSIDLVNASYDPVVSSRLRRAIEDEAPIGAGFRDTTCAATTRRVGERLGLITWAEAGVDPYWEMVPMLTLPRLSPRCRVVDMKTGGPWSGYTADRVTIKEGEFPAYEFHYRRRDLEFIEPFDLARSVEPIDPYPSWIVSPRLKAVLDRFDSTIVWHPVYVDEE